MKQSLRFLSLLCIIPWLTTMLHAETNFTGLPGNVIVKGFPNARGVDNVDCSISSVDEVTLAESKICEIEQTVDQITEVDQDALSKACVIESKLDNLVVNVDLSSEFDGTFTMIDAALSKACAAEDSVDIINENDDATFSKLCVVESKIDALDISDDLKEEFEGTFTLLATALSKACVVDETTDEITGLQSELESKICVIESIVDAIDVSVNLQEEFDGTFTALEELISKLCVIDEKVVESNEDADTIFSKACVIESTFDAIDTSLTFTTEFSQVDVVTDEILSKVCVVEERAEGQSSGLDVVESKVCALEVTDPSGDVAQEFGGTFTALEELKSKVCEIEDTVITIDETSDAVFSKACIVESQVENLFVNVDLSSEFDGTFTLIEELKSKVCEIEDNVDIVDDTQQALESKVDQFSLIDVSENLSEEFGGTFTAIEENISKLCVVDSKVDVVITELDEISTDDFGGTFTALDELLEKACSVDMKMDVISLSFMEGIVDRFTTIQEISMEVLDTITLIQEVSDQIMNEFSDIDDTVMKIVDKSITLESKLCKVEDDIDVVISDIDVIRTDDFGGTFTALDAVLDKACLVKDGSEEADDTSDEMLSKVCVVESKIMQLTGVTLDVSEEFNGTWTMIKAEISKACIIEDNIDVSDELTTDIFSKVCVIDSKLDALDVSVTVTEEFNGTFTALENVISKICVVDETTSTISDTVDDTLSKVCVASSKLDDLIENELDFSDEFNGSFTLINELTSKACLVEDSIDQVNIITDATFDKVCLTESRIDNLDISGTVTQDFADTQTVILDITSKVCVVEDLVDIGIDIVGDSFSKACVIESKVDAIDVSDDLMQEFDDTFTIIADVLSKACVVDDKTVDVDETTDTIESKVCVIESKVINLDLSTTVTEEFNATFTVIDAITEKVCAGLCDPTLISQADVPYTISSPGRYIVTEDLTLDAADEIVSIESSNVELDLCQKVLSGGSYTTGVLITEGLENVTVKNGMIRGIASPAELIDSAIVIEDDCSRIVIDDIDILQTQSVAIGIGTAVPTADPTNNVTISNCVLDDLESNGIVGGAGLDKIFIKNVWITGSTASAVRFTGTEYLPVTNVQMADINFYGNATSSGGSVVYFEQCKNVLVDHADISRNGGSVSGLNVVELDSCMKVCMNDVEISCNSANSPHLRALYLNGTSESTFINIRIQKNTGSAALEDIFEGIGLVDSDNNEFENCLVTQNSGGGIVNAYSLSNANNNSYHFCKAIGNTSAVDAAVVSGFSATSSECNVFTDCTATGHLATGSGGLANGFTLSDITKHLFIRCIGSCNQSTGFELQEDNYYAASVTETEFKDCQAMYNGVYGFDLEGGDDTVTLIRNIACRNGV